MANVPITRTERLLAMLVVQNMTGSQTEKCVRLSALGFGNGDIADLLDTSSGTVATNLSAARKAGKKKPAKKTAAKKAMKR